MGCKQSKIYNEKQVSRCKHRKDILKEAIASRNAFAAAHSGYFVALKDIGVALSAYGYGEAEFNHDDDTTQILDPEPNVLSENMDTDLPPPPLPDFSRNRIRPSDTMPVSLGLKRGGKFDSVDVNEEVDGDGDGDDGGLRPRRTSKRNVVERMFDKEMLTCTSPLVMPMGPPLLPESKGGPAWDYFFMAENTPVLSELDEAEEEDDDDGIDEIESHVFDERHSGGKINQTEPNTPGMVASSVDLLKVLEEIDNHFLEASQSAEEVAKMLEANRVHRHRMFGDNRGRIDHSARVMDVITWTGSFRNAASGDVVKGIFDSEECETQATVLDKLLVWEKKVIVEVKVTEMMKLEYQRKAAMLHKQKKRGVSAESLEKTKTAVNHLHTRYIVDMQSLDSTVSEVNLLRDSQLYAKHVSLVDGMANMWREISIHHDNQFKIATNLKSLDMMTASISTSQRHHDQTIELCNVSQEWNSRFEKLVICQKQYIHSLNNWLKLNINPTETRLNEKNPPIKSLIQSWNDYLEKLPDDLVKIAITSFTTAVKTIIPHQEEEMKLKEKCEEMQEELMRKDQAFEEWHKKYMAACKTQNEAKDPENDDHNMDCKDLVSERRFVIESLQKRLDDEVEAYQIQCLHVREKSASSLKANLPELFHALSDYARACHDAYERLGYLSKTQKQNGSS